MFFLFKKLLENLQTLVLSKCDAMLKYFLEMEMESLSHRSDFLLEHSTAKQANYNNMIFILL